MQKSIYIFYSKNICRVLTHVLYAAANTVTYVNLYSDKTRIPFRCLPVPLQLPLSSQYHGSEVVFCFTGQKQIMAPLFLALKKKKRRCYFFFEATQNSIVKSGSPANILKSIYCPCHSFGSHLETIYNKICRFLIQI